MQLDPTIKQLALPVLLVLAIALTVAWVASGERGPGKPSSELPTETNDIGIEFLRVPAGEFAMGSEGSSAFDEEKPATRVSVSAFWLSRYETTQAQWVAVMGANPSQYKDPNKPVDSVTWFEVQEFINRLNEKAGRAIYRLPSEAEWEYAARAGTTSRFYFGDNALEADSFAWIGQADGVGAKAVGKKAPNDWGFYDMVGNVWEWVADCWHDSYHNRPVDSQAWQSEGECDRRVMRGGGWNTPVERARSASRGSYSADLNDVTNGFRLARKENN